MGCSTYLKFYKFLVLQNQETKFYALQILEQVIKTRWKVLPRNQCEGIKKYIVGLIIKTSSDPETMENSRVYLNKLNIILVQVSYSSTYSLITLLFIYLTTYRNDKV